MKECCKKQLEDINKSVKNYFKSFESADYIICGCCYGCNCRLDYSFGIAECYRKGVIKLLKRFLTAEYEGATVVIPEYYKIKKELRILDIEKCYIDKVRVKEALTGTRKNIDEQYGWVKVDKKKWDELRL